MASSASLEYDPQTRELVAVAANSRVKIKTESGAPVADGDQFLRTLLLFGDSHMSRGNYGVTASNVTVSGRTVEVTATAHALFPGAYVFIHGAGDEFDGHFPVSVRSSSSVFQYVLPNLPTTSPSTTPAILAQTRYSDRNWLQYANQALGNPLRQIKNCGVPGHKAADLIDRFDRDVAAFRPDYVGLLIGTNDALGDTDQALFRSQIRWLVNAILTLGSKCILHTIPPGNDGAGNWTTTRQAWLLRQNAWIRQLSAKTRDVVLIDTHAVTVDAAHASGNFLANISNDGTHFSGRGAQVVGDYAVTRLQKLFVGQPPSVTSAADSYATDTASTQLASNPLMLEGAGGAIGGSVTETDQIPEGYTATETGSATVVHTLVARADGLGNDSHYVITATAANDALDVTLTSAATIAARVATGDTIYVECNLKGETLSAVSRIDFIVELFVDGVTYTISGANNSSTDSWVRDFDLWIRTPEFTIPAGSVTALQVRLKILFSGSGGATIDYGCMSINKVLNPDAL